MLIIAIGETLVSAGASFGSPALSPTALTAALLGFAIAAGLWWLYFDELGGAAERALLAASREQRPALARDGYTFGHFPLVAGVVYVALGVKLLLDDVTHGPGEPDLQVPTAALCGGVALYFAGLELVRWIVQRTWRPLVLLLAAALVVVPATWHLSVALVPLALAAGSLMGAGAASAHASIQQHEPASHR
jgi:low temperature requirement protein LtrA